MRFSIATAVILCMLTQALPAFSQSVQETEPNDTPETADTAKLGGKVSGDVGCSICDNDPFDYWVIFATKGDTIHVDVDSCPSCVDAHTGVALLAADGQTILAHGAPWDGDDEYLKYVATVSGRYFIRVSGSLYGSPPYTLTFAEPKCPTDPGEPNETRENARSVVLGSVIKARWCPLNDRDFYKIQLDAGTILEYSLDRYLPGDYYDNDHLGSPGVHLLGPSGEVLDSLVTTDLGPMRFAVATTGTYYLQPFRERGRMAAVYELSVRAGGQLPPGPGDPPSVIAKRPLTSFEYLAVDRHGDFWATPGANDPLLRLSLDGTITTFNEPDLGWMPAFDPWGNLLTAHYPGVTKFSPPNRTERLITFAHPGPNGMAVALDAIWILGPNYLEKYSLTGQLLESHPLAQPNAISLKLGPSGDPYFASRNEIYRFVAGHAELVLRHEASSISGFVFDDQGNIYVTQPDLMWPDTLYGKARVSLHDHNGAMVADSFAWWPHEPYSPAFGRNPDGTTNNRLFIVDGGLDGAQLLELNRTGIRAPGLPVQPTGICPVQASEAEPNDSPANAHAIAVDTDVVGVSCMAGDEDFFQFIPARTQRITLQVEGADEPTLELLGADGTTRLAYSETPTSSPRIMHSVEAGKKYFARVRSWFGGPTPYTLRVRTPLVRPEGLTIALAARELIRPNEVLNSAQRTYLDVLGNNDGRYDVGDFRAYYLREHAAP